MSVGNQANVNLVNGMLTTLATRWRDLASDTLEASAFFNKLGLTGLENLGGTGNGFGSANNPANPGSVSDAQYVLNLINYLTTCAQVFQGTGTQATAFNFQDATTVLWAGQ